MNSPHHIRYLSHDEIDKLKWDACIDRSVNSLIYGFSYYLDHMSIHWDALVFNDYEAVMPLTWNKKYGISYLYQPAFTASLGIFGEQIDDRLTNEFIEAIPAKFKLVEISLNFSNPLPAGKLEYSTQVNYTLSLATGYDQLKSSYHENVRRNVAKAQKLGYSFHTNIPVEDIVALSKPAMQNLTNVKDSDYKNFCALYYFLHRRNQAHTYGIYNPKNVLAASCVFFFDKGRAYYILVGNHPGSKNTGASHFLIDRFIYEHASRNILLDFEGSDIASLARFYSSFGASVENYPFLKINRLPFGLKWMV